MPFDSKEVRRRMSLERATSTEKEPEAVRRVMLVGWQPSDNGFNDTPLYIRTQEEADAHGVGAAFRRMARSAGTDVIRVSESLYDAFERAADRVFPEIERAARSFVGAELLDWADQNVPEDMP
jgi:hypothetical protein